MVSEDQCTRREVTLDSMQPCERFRGKDHPDPGCEGTDGEHSGVCEGIWG